MGDGGGAELAGGAHQVLGDDGARQGRHERVGALVQGVGLERRHAVLGGELVAGVRHVGLNGTAVEGSLTDDLQVLTTLADVDGDRDDLSSGLLADPADCDGGVQAS